MSTLNVSNITDGTTTVGTGYVVNGSAKAWSLFNGRTTPFGINDSYNVSSLTDISLGVYRITFTNSFSSSNYAVPAAAADTNAGYVRIPLPFTGDVVTSSYYNIGTDDSGSNPDDSSYVHSACFGDLA